jgi:uncharacterized membrane protein YkvA (DUF1232 family)
MQMPTVSNAMTPATSQTRISRWAGVCDKTSWAIRDVVDAFEAWADHSTMSQRARHWARLVKRDVHAICRAARDPRVPWYAKALAICVAGYALSPIDLIPDFVPVLGYLDDVIIVPLGILMVVKLISPEIMAEHRAVAAAAQDRRVSHTAAVVIAIVWASGSVGAGWFCYRVFVS